jgi:hypothetical protein
VTVILELYTACMTRKLLVYAVSSLRTNLIVMLSFILFISLFTFAEPIELTVRDGATWNGKIGDRVEVIAKSGRKLVTIEGILKSSTELAIVVEFDSRGKPIMINSIESITTLDVSDDLQIIEKNDDKEIATPSIEIDLAKLLFFFHKGYRSQYGRQKFMSSHPSIEIDLAKLLFFFHKGYRFQYGRQKFMSSHPLKSGNITTQISQPMIQPVIQQSSNRYAVIDLSGSFGEIEKLPNRTYSTSFITACTLAPSFKEIKKQAKKIRHVVFLINSTGGDKGAIFEVSQLLGEYSAEFTYHGVVLKASPELSPLIARFANTYSLNSKGGPNSVSSVADIGRKLGLQEWVEAKQVTSYAGKQRLTLRKRMLSFMAEEDKLFLSILQYKNALEQASLSLEGIYKEYGRILDDEKRFLDASLYEKRKNRCYLETTNRYVEYETGYLSSKGKNAWDNNFSSLARNWDYCCMLVNRAGSEITKLNKLLTKIESEKKKYHKQFDCITVTHESMRNQYMDNINDQLTLVFVNLQNEVTRLVNYHVLPCYKKDEVISRRGNYPEYYVEPPCSRFNSSR